MASLNRGRNSIISVGTDAQVFLHPYAQMLGKLRVAYHPTSQLIFTALTLTARGFPTDRCLARGGRSCARRLCLGDSWSSAIARR